MKVNVGEMSSKINSINNDLSDFESLYQSIFREVDIARSYWNDSNAEKFSNSMINEKNQSIRLYQELSSRRDIYQFVKDEYSRSGNVITYDQNRKADFLYRLSEAKSKISEAQSKLRETYEGGLGYYCAGAAGYFNNVLANDLDYYMRVLDDCYSEVNRYLSDFENIENRTKQKIDNLRDYTYESYNPVKIPRP